MRGAKIRRSDNTGRCDLKRPRWQRLNTTVKKKMAVTPEYLRQEKQEFFEKTQSNMLRITIYWKKWPHTHDCKTKESNVTLQGGLGGLQTKHRLTRRSGRD
jgi:hypothetical protein